MGGNTGDQGGTTTPTPTPMPQEPTQPQGGTDQSGNGGGM